MRSIVLIVVSLIASAALAADNDIEPLMTVRGKLVISEDFAGPQTQVKWTNAKGKWVIDGGVVRGSEVPADNHPASYRNDLVTTSHIFQFDFKFDGGTGCFRWGGPSGNIARFYFTPTTFSVQKDGSHTDKSDKTIVLDRLSWKLEKGKWYTMVVEISGDQLVGRVGDHTLVCSDPKIAAAKTSVGWMALGDGIVYDNFRAWEATPTPGWPATRAKLLESREKQAKTAAKPKS